MKRGQISPAVQGNVDEAASPAPHQPASHLGPALDLTFR